MPQRNRHKEAEVEAVLQYAETKQWRIETPRAHWGIGWCPCGEHHISISGTPQNAGSHARKLRRAIDACPGPDEEKED